MGMIMLINKSMDTIIKNARNNYPNNRTQQFYRIIKPFIDSVFASTNDKELKSDSFIDEKDGIKVIRQFFPYNGHRYCFWICLFPKLTPEGKKNAYYGIERQKDDQWQALWSEADDNFHFWFKLRVAARVMDENDDIFAALNPFEYAIKNAPYDSDIFEERKIITDIIMEYSKFGCKERCHKELNIGNLKCNFYLFKLYDNWYLWIDSYENGLLESFRLDVVFNSNTSFVLFSNVSNDEQLPLPDILRFFRE